MCFVCYQCLQPFRFPFYRLARNFFVACHLNTFLFVLGIVAKEFLLNTVCSMLSQSQLVLDTTIKDHH